MLTLILGALGSGLWEIAVKPIFSLLMTLALNVVTLGLESLRNDMYADVARGFHEAPSLMLLGITITGSVGFLAGYLFGGWYFPKTKGGNGSGLLFSLKLIILFGVILIFFILFRSTYINRAITHYEQMTAIVAPYITEHEKIDIKSKFAQIKTKDDYVRIINRLTQVAQENKLYVPTFSIY